ncbi:PD-(D/E)XK nuclease family protein [Patescibacteria group bacterium]|nr:PD-(D/E)XK nuclease family protein [Patescibacteria group bacterium]MCL5091352.1 PD-(D/E)XK nuclease family protein [Patescibacteria group bacterium]
MSQYYRSRRSRGLYRPDERWPFRISRSKIDLFLNCPRCFYLDRRLGVSQPPGFPFTLNAAVDKLLKKEFDQYRRKNQPHPLMEHYRINAVPFAHPQLDQWRDALKGGVEYLDPSTNLLITGAIDDVWVERDGQLIVVDYKATAKNHEVNLDSDWQLGYKRQMEVYQWLLRRNRFRVSSTGYFVYCNGQTDRSGLDGKLEFAVKLIPYTGDDGWVEEALVAMKKTLDQDDLPAVGPDCDYCAYRQAVSSVENQRHHADQNPVQRDLFP